MKKRLLICLFIPLTVFSETKIPTAEVICKDGQIVSSKYNHKYPELSRDEKVSNCLVDSKISDFEKIEEHLSGELEVQLNYPFNGPYQMAMGINPNLPKEKGGLFNRPKLKDLRMVTEASTIIGVDPMMVLALGISENPGEIAYPNKNLHDTSMAASFGCNTDTSSSKQNQIKKLDSGEKEKMKLFYESYNKNRKPADQNLFNGAESGKGSYACVKIPDGNTNFDFGSFELLSNLDSVNKSKGYCCQELPFKHDPGKFPYDNGNEKGNRLYPSRYHENPYADAISLYAAIKRFKTLQNQPAPGAARNPNSPEAKLQTFNGFSHSSGQGIGSVMSAFRMGADTYKNPTYGAQAMDFYLNTIMPNETIKTLIKESQEHYKTNPKDLLCSDNPNKSLSLPINHYLEMHGNTPRHEKMDSWVKHPGEQKKEWDAAEKADEKEKGVNSRRDKLAKLYRPLLYELHKMKDSVAKAKIADYFKKNDSENDLESSIYAIINKQRVPKGPFQGFSTEVENNDYLTTASLEHEFSDKQFDKFNNFISFYFKEIFPDRNTVKKSSMRDNPNYDWQIFSEADYLKRLRAMNKSKPCPVRCENFHE